MKVLYSCMSKSWGGMEMFTLSAVEQLRAKGITVDLICYPDSPIFKNALKKKINTVPIKYNKGFNPAAILKVLKLLKNNNYDVIHTQASGDLWVLSPAAELYKKKIPIFLTKQVGSFIIKKDFLHRFVYSKVTAAFAISNVIRKNLLETTPLTSNQIFILHNGVDTHQFNPQKYSGVDLRKKFNIAEDEIIVGMAARFTPGKGYEELIKAAKMLKNKFTNVKYLLVGEASMGEEKYFQKIKTLVKELELNNEIIFAGYQKNMPEAFAAMDIFAFPSHSEAFGIALVEAMSMGLPSVCSRSDGLLDICVENETGLFFEPKNKLSLAEKLETLIVNSNLRKRLSDNARKRAINFFDIKKQTERVTEFYKNYI